MAWQGKLIAELRDQDRVSAVLRVVRKAAPLSRSGKRFLAVTLGDRSGEIEARAFDDDVQRLEPLVPSQGYARVEAVAELYKGRLELKLLDAQAVQDAEVDPADFLPRTRFDTGAMFAEVRRHVEQVRNEHVRALLLSFLDDPELGPAFQRAPAAKSVHHAFVGGLLEHTLSVLQLGLRVCDHYPELDRDLVVAGCLLHDFGKTIELRADNGFEYTEPGRLVGHLLMTCQWIHERARRIPDFPPRLEQHLVHLVAAHHGQLEHGSPKEPATLEAVVVHAVDELDSRINSFELIFARDRSQRAWTDWSRLYDRPLFKGPSWNGEPLPPDPRRFEGPGLYEPRQRELPLPATPAAAPQPRRLEYDFKLPERHYAPQLAPQGPRPPEPQLPDRPQKPASPLPLDLFKLR
jgi:3'-5' exoribonuclease